MELAKALEWAGQRKHATLITIRKDGRPQSSDIAYAVDGEQFMISVTDDRAKTHNMRRDPRVVLHLSDPSSWTYLSFDGTVDLSPITTEPYDQTGDELVRYYTAIAGEHSNWDEYRQAMIDEQRLIARFTPSKVVGQIN